MSSIKLKHSGGNSVSLNPPSSAPTSSDVAFKLPNADGSAGQYMKTDGSGNLAFATVATPTVQPTVWDTWVLTSGQTGEGDITSNLARLTNTSNTPALAFGYIGTGMTESSGIFTFPQTGIWQVKADIQVSHNANNQQQYQLLYIQASTNSGSGYATIAEGSNASVNYGTSSIHADCILDITDESITRIKFSTNMQQNNNSSWTIDAGSNLKRTGFQFIRWGDT